MPHLRDLGVLGKKHIPDAYMLASAEQRLSLLQGLIDTDGSASPDNGCITFAQRDRWLAEQVRTLANSLGFKARLTPARTSGSWQVVFQASRAQRPCRLPRKLASLPEQPRRLGSQGWRIHSIEPVETVPTNCIQVEAADGLYLIGRELIPTHNSTIITFAGSIQAICADPEMTIGIFSATKKIAHPFLDQIKYELETSDALKESYPDVLWENPRRQAPSWSVERGITVKRRSNPKEKTVEAFGLLDGMPTGRHFRRLVYDDVINHEHVDNPDIIRKVTERIELSTNLGVGEATERLACGTRYSFADTYGIKMEDGTFKPRIYAATHDGTLDGQPIFLTQKAWDKVKIEQRSVVAAQMLQNPIAGKENTFMPGWFRKWEVRPSILTVYIMGDPSGGRSKNSDRTAIAVVGVDGAGNKYFLDGYRHRMGLSDRWAALRGLFMKWSDERGVTGVRVGWEKYGLQADVEYFNEQMRAPGSNLSFEISELNWTSAGVGNQGKKARVGRLEPDMRNGRFFMPAIVYDPGRGDCYWHVDEKASHIVKIPVRGKTKMMTSMDAAGQSYRNAKSIRRLDEDRKPYDVALALMEEMMFFPFAPKDDLVDATSRIYDMDLQRPSPGEDAEIERIGKMDWIDA
jgi:hypothetical protein